MENSEKKKNGGGLNLKATELRLGLPGSVSPERDCGNPLLPPPPPHLGGTNVSGAKRGFSVAINDGGSSSSAAAAATANWVFSPRGADTGKLVSGSHLCSTVENGLPDQSPKAVMKEKKTSQVTGVNGHRVASSPKAQVVGWPPIRSFRKNSMASHSPKNDDENDAEANLGSASLYVKVNMDGAPYLRKVDLTTYDSYMQLSSALEKMFSCFTIGQCSCHGVPSRDGSSESRLMDLLHGSEYVLTYEDKDGDWMLVGDVPWKMFIDTCRRLRIMKSSDATGLAPRATEKCRNK